jgi:antitoxin MazE
MNAKLINIGNSKGIRIPKKLIEKYRLQENLEIEEKPGGILIKSKDTGDLYTWNETFREMAAEKESWDDFEDVVDDGID